MKCGILVNLYIIKMLLIGWPFLIHRKEPDMYRCLCGAVFEKPLKRRETAYHGYGIRETLFYRLCPECNFEEPYFEEFEEGEEHDYKNTNLRHDSGGMAV